MAGPEIRTLKTAPPTRINAPHCPSYVVDSASKQNPCQRPVVTVWVNVLRRGATVFNVVIQWSITKRVEVESDRIE
jgi:hypothetical protein